MFLSSTMPMFNPDINATMRFLFSLDSYDNDCGFGDEGDTECVKFSTWKWPACDLNSPFIPTATPVDNVLLSSFKCLSLNVN